MRRSGYVLQEGQAVEFAETVERMLQDALGVPPHAAAELDEPELEAEEPARGDEDELDAEPAHEEL